MSKKKKINHNCIEKSKTSNYSTNVYCHSVGIHPKKKTIDQVSCIKFLHQINIYGRGKLFWCSLKSPRIYSIQMATNFHVSV